MCEPVPMGARSGSRAVPARKGVADGVFAHCKPGVVAKVLHVGARAQVGLAEDDARHHRRLGLGDLRKRVQFCDQAVDRELGRAVCHRSRSQRMPAPVFVDEILRRLLAQRAKPLRAVGRHPDEVAGLRPDTSESPSR